MTLSHRKQNGLWLEGDLYREKLSEQENGSNKMATVTGILSGVDDISINDCNKGRPGRKAGSKLVSPRQAVDRPCIGGIGGRGVVMKGRMEETGLDTGVDIHSRHCNTNDTAV